jgi:hypothetical protein
MYTNKIAVEINCYCGIIFFSRITNFESHVIWEQKLSQSTYMKTATGLTLGNLKKV